MTNRRDFLVKFTMAVGAVSYLRPLTVFAGVATGRPVLPGTRMITILHTANLKGQWSALGIGETMAGFGGLENISQKIATIKNEHASTLVIDAGNMTGLRQTSEERLSFYKKASRAGYDFIVPSRTDLMSETDRLTELIKENNLNAVSLVHPTALNGAALPYSVIQKEKIRIGIINAGLPALKAVQKASTLQAVGAINQTAKLLRSLKKCALIVCVVQSSEKRCAKLAGLSAGVDVMIGSMDKTSLHNTQIVRNQSNDEVILTYAGEKGAMMSRIDIACNEKGEKTSMASKAIFTGNKNESFASLLKKCDACNA